MTLQERPEAGATSIGTAREIQRWLPQPGRNLGGRRSLVTFVAIIALVGGGLSIPIDAHASGPMLMRPNALAPGSAPLGAIRLGPVPGNQPLRISVVLRPSKGAQLHTLLHNLYDPKSPEYHRWLGRGVFQHQFGPTHADFASTESWLHTAGLTQTSVSGSAVTVTAPADQVSKALGTSFDQYRDPTGRVGDLAQKAPLVPQSLAGGQIAAILGLNTVATFKPHLVTGSASRRIGAAVLRPHADGLTPCAAAQAVAGSSYYTLDALGAAYGIGSLLTNGQNGHGQTIGLYELASHSTSDVASYQSCLGLVNPVSTVAIDGGGGAVGGGGTGEADVDIQQAATQAPGASVISYEGPNTAPGAYDTWNAIVTADAAQVISTSWGMCEPLAVSSGALGSETTLFQQAAAQGQTVLAASGDSGTEDCYRYAGPLATTAQVDYPASDAWVTAVGGSSLSGPGIETAWNYCQGNENTACADSWGGQAAGGGGMSRYNPRPSYQPNILMWQVAQSCGQSCREVPDLSANSGIGMVAYVGSTWVVGFGTSLAAPFIGGLVADKNNGCTTATGVWTPALYALAAQGSYGTALTDITSGDIDMSGSNGGVYPAATGYDAATGLGSPLAPGLSCPEVASVSAGYSGAQVTISGLGLEHATIHFGGTAAHVLSATATSATVVVPAGSGTVTVGGTSVLGTGTQTTSFTYGSVPPPPPPTPAPTPTPPTPRPPPAVTNGTLPAPVVGIASLADGSGYWLTNAQGGVSAHGYAVSYGSMAGTTLNAPISHIVSTPDGRGYWLVAADGGTFSFGDAGFYGSMGGRHLNAPVVDIAPTSDGLGYWLVASDGGIFAFGDAQFHGSMGGQHLNKPVVGIAADNQTGGYWEVATDGGIFAFGAPFFGSTGGIHLNKPVNGMTATADDQGYWFVASDGGIFAGGNAQFSGSTGGRAINAPIVGMASDASSGGYWLVGSDGGIFAFKAAFYGAD